CLTQGNVFKRPPNEDEVNFARMNGLEELLSKTRSVRDGIIQEPFAFGNNETSVSSSSSSGRSGNSDFREGSENSYSESEDD
ncbi:hypothetical protein M758_9G057200, partial [Ceratodon purpureus]